MDELADSKVLTSVPAIAPNTVNTSNIPSNCPLISEMGSTSSLYDVVL